MKVPARYRYDPSWRMVTLAWTLVAASTIAVLPLGTYSPKAHSIAVVSLTILVAFAAMITLRRYAFPRFLVLDEEGLWLPSGFLRMYVQRVEFAETSAVWEALLPGNNPVLCLHSHGKTFEVHSNFLPDFESYVAVGNLIYSRLENRLPNMENESDLERRLRTMLGTLHLFGFCLLAGAFGLHWFYGRLFPSLPKWTVWAVMLLPWVTIHVITFCNQPPFGPHGFRRCLLAVVCAYGLLTAVAEAVQFVYRLPADRGFSVTPARVLMYFGCVSFIPFVRAYLVLRDSGPANDA